MIWQFLLVITIGLSTPSEETLWAEVKYGGFKNYESCIEFKDGVTETLDKSGTIFTLMKDCYSVQGQKT